MKILGIAFIALMCTLLVTFGAMEVVLWCYRHDIDTPVTKEMLIGAIGIVFVWFYHWCWKKSK